MELHCPVAITPLNFYTWNLLLANSAFEDANWVLKGIKFGFPLGTGDGALKSAKRNCITALRQPEIIDNYLQEEIRYGSVAGPFDAPPLPDLHINRFGVIPKSTPGKFRLITDLSFPLGNSVNDLIDDSEAEVSYAGIPEALAMIMKLGQGAMLAKFDIKRAYRLLPVYTLHRPFLGMQWKGKFYVDLAIPFGIRSGPKIFTRFGDSLQFLLGSTGGVNNVIHYLDDFLLAGPASSLICERNLQTCFSLCEKLGVPIAEDKTEGPNTEITFLGFTLDSVKQELRLPNEKLLKVRAALSSWDKKKSGTKRELLSLIGLLQHCCQAIVLGRPFLRRLIDRAHSVSDLHHFVKLSQWERDDLQWWFRLLHSWNGKSLFLFPTWEQAPMCAITSDAAGSIGFAAINGTQWFAGVWPKGASNINIAVKELIPIVLAANIWGSTWSRKRIAFKCDNMAVVLVLRQGSCKDRHLAFLLRELSILAVLHSFTFTAVHIPGCRNVQADALSRSDFQAFFKAAPDADTVSLTIPERLLHQLTFPPWTVAGKAC